MISEREGYLILMADGNIDDHNIVKNAARDCGINHVFSSVYNGRQLLDYLFEKGVYSGRPNVQPDLIIMDIRLDLVDGFDVLKFLSESKKIYIPVYILTKTKREEDVVKAQGFFDIKGYFQKPLTSEDYTKMVQGICKENFTYNQQKN